MEFISYLDEADFMVAGKIAVKKTQDPFSRALAWAYPFIFFLFIWCTFLLGMILDSFIRTKSGWSQMPLRHLFIASAGPAVILYYMMIFVLHPLARWPVRRRRRERFRSNPACQLPTTVIVSSDLISFRCAKGSSQSTWDCYENWGERAGIVVLLTRAGVRQIVKISGLPSKQQQEFRSILAAALPQK